MTTKELASKLKITARQLRRILRGHVARYNDGVYTRYKLTENDCKLVMKALTPPEKAAA